MWNRRQATLAWEWDLMETEFGEDEEIRLEYQFAANKNYRISPVTKRPEPYLAPWKRVGRYALSRTGVIFLVNDLFFKNKIRLSHSKRNIYLTLAVLYFINCYGHFDRLSDR
jgi:hypothetical protein